MITSCGGGIAASVTFFALRLLGRDKLALDDNSLLEWSADPARPMVRRPQPGARSRGLAAQNAAAGQPPACPQPPSPRAPTRWPGQSVAIGGPQGLPDDHVLADRDGILRISAADVAAVVAAAERQLATEGAMVRAIRAGEDPQAADLRYRVC